jgi:Arylsulfotransferase (ASST)
MLRLRSRSSGGAPREPQSPLVGSVASKTKQSGGRQCRLALVATSALLIAGLFGAGAGAKSPPPGPVSFSVPSLFPTFAPSIHDYVVRCDNGPVTVNVHASTGWEAAIGNHTFRRGDFSEVVPLSSGRDFTVAARDVGRTQLYHYYVRCLPNNFPTYTYTQYGPVSPKYLSVDPRASSGSGHYAIIFDDHGVPVWWYHGSAYATRVLPNGKILWFDGGTWATHRLNGSWIRTLRGVGRVADSHDLRLAANGDHFVGAYVKQSHVDTSAYGGSSDTDVLNAELQEVSPHGQLVWDWKSQQHISLAETGRWWPGPQPAQGYDLVHWNSIEPAGGSVIASFRTVDAVYKIDKSTGNIVWKLGGTTTPRSLAVQDDPRSYTFGGQHDARLLPDGTLTVFDNRSYLGQAPRAVRYRIDEQAGTATLLQSITDPAVSNSDCCGSARRVGGGDWLIDWGLYKPIGGYKPNGEKTFSLTFNHTFSYRAEPVPTGVLSAQDLRQAMDAMCSSGCG